MPLTSAYTGGTGFTGAAIEYRPGGSPSTPGTVQAPTDFLPVKKNALKPSMGRVKEKVQSATRYANRINVPTIVTTAGQLDYFLNAALGLTFWEALLGAKASIAAGTATATTAIATTTNGVTTLTVAGTYTKGTPIWVNTDDAGVATSNTEVAQVIGTGSGTVMVRGLTKNATMASGKYVFQPGSTKIANSLLPSGYGNQLPLLTVEKNKGGLYAFQYPSVYAEKLDLTFGNSAVDGAFGLYGTQPFNLLNATGTPIGDEPVVGAFHTYNPSSQDEDAALAPYTTQNAAFTIAGDPDATGADSVRAAIGLTSFKLSFNNNLIKKPVLGNSVMQAWPGDDVTLDLEYDELDTANWPHTWFEQIEVNGGADFYFCCTTNLGTITAPTFRTVAGYIPYAKFEDAADDDTIGDIGKYTTKASGMVLRGLAQDLLQVYFV